MAVDAVNPGTPTVLSTPADTSPTDTAPSSTPSSTKKVDPNSETEILNAAVEAFIPGMMSNMLTLNNSLFNYAKEAMDESDEG